MKGILETFNQSSSCRRVKLNNGEIRDIEPANLSTPRLDGKWSGDVELDSFIDVPLVFLDAVIFTSFELYFLDVFIASKSVDGSASFCAHGGEEGLLLKHGSFVDDVLVHVLLAVVAHPT